MIKNPKISVIIPFNNVEKYLAECLDSVIGQTYKNLEIIAIDDGSTDGSLTVAQKYSSKIKIIRQKKSGVSVARNVGLDAATGEWVHFMDADDKLATNDFYEKIMALIGGPDASDIDVAAVGVLDEKYGAQPTFSYKRARTYRRAQAKINATSVARRPAVWNYVFRRDMLLRHGLQFEPGRVTSQDVMFTIPAVYYARAVVTVPGVYYWYRRNPTGAMRDPARESARRENKEIVWARAAKFAADHGFWFGPRRALGKWIRAKLKLK